MSTYAVRTVTNYGTFRSTVQAHDAFHALDVAATKVTKAIAAQAARQGLENMPAVVIRDTHTI